MIVFCEASSTGNNDKSSTNLQSVLISSTKSLGDSMPWNFNKYENNKPYILFEIVEFPRKELYGLHKVTAALFFRNGIIKLCAFLPHRY